MNRWTGLIIATVGIVFWGTALSMGEPTAAYEMTAFIGGVIQATR